MLTRTAGLHARSWKRLFDAFLEKRAGTGAAPFQPFDTEVDFPRHVDGKPRADGVRDFLASRGIVLPEGDADAPSGEDSVSGLCKRKDALFHAALAQDGVQVFESSVAFLRDLRSAGIRTALVSSSRNATAVVAAAGLAELFDQVVDGVAAARLGLRGKPAPDTFVHAAASLGIEPARMFGVEDALAGVQAIRAAGYGLAVGVDRHHHAMALRDHGADIEVLDLSELRAAQHPAATGAARNAPPDGLPLMAGTDPLWTLREEGPTGPRERTVESLFAIGNGHLGMRASLAEGGPSCTPGTFVAGVFNEQPDGTVVIAGAPEWAGFGLEVDGKPLDVSTGRIVAHARVLDMRQGASFRTWKHVAKTGEAARFDEVRLASATDRRLLLQSVALSLDNGGEVHIDAGPRTARTVTPGGKDVVVVATAVASTLPGSAADAPLAGARDPSPGGTVAGLRFDRVAAIHTSRDGGDPGEAATRHAEAAMAAGFGQLAGDHVRAWNDAWSECDLQVDGDPDLQRAVRFAIYHLLSAADPDDDRVSIGARGLTGLGYGGHVFWDTELYMLPFFVLTRPRTARTLLGYRHRTLPAARRRAAALGHAGALYAWESADTGDDVTPAVLAPEGGAPIRVLTGEQEIHVNADVAFAAWQYWRASGDDTFLLDAGAEILIETARYWASRARLGSDGQYHLEGVVGPDEFHEAVDDNAYTNAMARWNLRAAERTVALVRRRRPERWTELAGRIGFDKDEPARWRAIARAMYSGLDPATGLIEQFRGYFRLQDIDLATFPRDMPADAALGRERVQRSQVIKQPDVLMLLHLLWDAYPSPVREANFRYYAPRCAHGSSLSPSIHALLAARLGDLPLALRYLRAAMDIDLAPGGVRSAAGVHLGALGGLWQAVVFGFGGLHFRGNAPALSARLPAHWQRLALQVAWRGRRNPLAATAGDTNAR